MKTSEFKMAELAHNATGGEKPHAETAESAEFKMTELGPIPVDWEVKRFDECFALIRNNTYARECMTDHPGSVANIHYGDVLIKYGAVLDFAKDAVPYLKSEVKPNKDMLRDGDIVFADTAEDEAVGKAVEVQGLKSRLAVAGLHTVASRPHDGLFAQRYLGYYINSAAYHNQLLPLITGTKVSSVSRACFLSTYVAIPPKSEQRRIARALSDVDELISALGKLIEKKRNIKTGAMQQLLTGKTRLPGFSVKSPRSLRPLRDEDSPAANAEVAEYKMTELGPIPKDWEVKRLGEIVNIMDNRRVPLSESQRKSGIFPYCGANGIVDFIDRYEFDEEAILIAEDGGNFSDFATRPIAYKMSGKYWVNNHAHVLTAKVGCELDYLLFHLAHKDITDIISGGTRAKLTRGQLENIIISLPTLAEQKAIAAVLSDMDAEIASLEADRMKYESIKQGMMQELLTGRTRLKGE